jgi:endonuclease/exonuclease/phosphatase family metal-dependent hydrolase
MHCHKLLLSYRILAVFFASAVATVCVADDAHLVNDCLEQPTANTLPPNALSVLSLNISHGRKTALNQLFVGKERTYRNLGEITELLEATKANVVALQEADGPSRWSGNFDHVAYLAQQSRFHCRTHGLHSRRWISSYGTALLSRSRPLASASVRFSPSWPSKQKGYVSSTFAWMAGGKDVTITFVSVHFDFLRASVRDRQADEMVADLSDIDGPLILMGDINSQWGDKNSTVRRLAGALKLRAFFPERDGLGTYKGPDGKRLDWILISQDLEFRDYKTVPDVVSDHYAVYAEIAYRGKQE